MKKFDAKAAETRFKKFHAMATTTTFKNAEDDDDIQKTNFDEARR